MIDGAVLPRSDIDQIASPCDLSSCKGCHLCQSPSFLLLLESYTRTDKALRHLLYAQNAQLAALRESCSHLKQTDNLPASRCIRCGLRFKPSEIQSASDILQSIDEQIFPVNTGQEEACLVPGEDNFTSSSGKGKRRRDDSFLFDFPEPEQSHGRSARMELFSIEGNADLSWEEL